MTLWQIDGRSLLKLKDGGREAHPTVLLKIQPDPSFPPYGPTALRPYGPTVLRRTAVIFDTNFRHSSARPLRIAPA